MIRDRLGAKPLVLQVPIGAEASLTGVVDLVKMKAQVWKNEALGAEWEYKDCLLYTSPSPRDRQINIKFLEFVLLIN